MDLPRTLAALPRVAVGLARGAVREVSQRLNGPQQPGARPVTFTVPEAAGASYAHLVGDFNDWSTTSTPLTRQPNGDLAVTIELAPGTYRYRFLLDAQRWDNDWAADRYVPNEFGSEDSVIDV